MAAWPYNTGQWHRLRQLKLSVNTLCEPCFKRGRLEPATVVDHIIAIGDGGDPFPGLEGLQSLCASCHNWKTAALERAGGKGVAMKGCDAAGNPIDPAHPFYQKDPISPSKDQQLKVKDRRGTRRHNSFGN
jgi:hypothetical protein